MGGGTMARERYTLAYVSTFPVLWSDRDCVHCSHCLVRLEVASP
jgi:hypothetical protein